MTTRLRKELRFLRLYVVFSVPVLAVLLFAAISERAKAPYFEEITVERINVVEPDGTRKLVIASSARQTEGTIGGVQIPIERTRPAGLVFFNDYGDEVGGLGFGGDRTKGGQYLAFDQAGQDQVLTFVTREWTDDQGRRLRTSGIELVDRPTDRTLLDVLALMRELEAIEDPEERARARAQIDGPATFGAPRMFVGRTAEGQATVALMDGRGRYRLRMVVEADGAAAIEFLDAEGNVIRRIGPETQ
ncbi:MAG TPA: hypothetical protein VF158_02480 [Longimicrobiales bacterium]